MPERLPKTEIRTRGIEVAAGWLSAAMSQGCGWSGWDELTDADVRAIYKIVGGIAEGLRHRARRRRDLDRENVERAAFRSVQETKRQVAAAAGLEEDHLARSPDRMDS